MPRLLAMRRAIFIVCAAFAALLAVCATTVAKTEVTRSRGVTASLLSRGVANQWQLRLKIRDRGGLAYDEPVGSPLCRSYCGPLLTGAHRSALRVADLERDGHPDVVLSLYTERRHCCALDQVFSRAPGGLGYVRAEHDFGHAGARLARLGDGTRTVFVSANDAFFGRFTSYAASGAPIQIWAFRHGRFVDVTRAYPGVLQRDAERWRRTFTANYADGEGFLAAWAADEQLLGQGALVRQTLADQAVQGHLRSDRRRGGARGERFVEVLQRFLRRHGYVTR